MKINFHPMSQVKTHPELETLLAEYSAPEIVTALNEMLRSSVLLLSHEPESLPETIGNYERVSAVRDFFLSKAL
jgi:hypothetical protein